MVSIFSVSIFYYLHAYINSPNLLEIIYYSDPFC